MHLNGQKLINNNKTKRHNMLCINIIEFMRVILQTASDEMVFLADFDR